MKSKLHLSRPKDRSFKAYQEWIEEIANSLDVGSEDLSDEECRQGWKEFWGNKKRS